MKLHELDADGKPTGATISTNGHRPGQIVPPEVHPAALAMDELRVRLIADELDAHNARLAALEARVAERDEQFARLRREMDALVAVLRRPMVHGPALALAHECAYAVDAVVGEAKPCG